MFAVSRLWFSHRFEASTIAWSLLAGHLGIVFACLYRERALRNGMGGGRGVVATRLIQHMVLALFLTAAWIRFGFDFRGFERLGMIAWITESSLYFASGVMAAILHGKLRTIRAEELGGQLPRLREVIDPRWEIVHWGVSVPALFGGAWIVARYREFGPMFVLMPAATAVVTHVGYVLYAPLLDMKAGPISDRMTKIFRSTLDVLAILPIVGAIFLLMFAHGSV